MKRLSIEEKFEALLKINGVTATMAHIAMALVLKKTRAEMSPMYGQGTLSTCLHKLKNLNVVKIVDRGEWELTSPELWGKAEVASTAPKDNEKEATLELMADLEKQIKELKKRVG